MPVEIIKGDLLDAFDRGEVDIIGHVVNCQSVMGSGIALAIKNRYPNVYKRYLDSFPEALKEGVTKDLMLGHVEVIDGVANMYAQFKYGADKRHLNYGAISQCLSSLAMYGDKSYIFGFPYKMGCDRAGGDWSVVLEMIEYYFNDVRVKIYEL